MSASAFSPRYSSVRTVLFGLVLFLSGTPAGARSPGRTPVQSVDVLPGDPVYRELRLAAALGLTLEAPHGADPLTRAELHRLLAGIDPAKAGDFAPRFARVLRALAPWQRYRESGGRRTVLEWNPSRSGELSGSDVRRGDRAHRPLWNGSDRTEGVAFESDASLVLEESELSFQVEGRLAADRDELTVRPLALLVLTEIGNARFTLGREPLSWGPAVHGNSLLTTNARPLDQFRVESASTFRLPGWFREIGAWRAAAFTGRLNDPDRSDFANPWLAGLRLTVAPTRWLVLGGTRTAMLGGQGNRFHLNVDSIWDLLTAAEENHPHPDNNTDQKASLEGSLYLWPLLRSVPVLRGGRLYAELAGDDALQGVPPLPSSPAATFGLELVGAPALLRVEVARNQDDTALWYWHFLYTDGYTYRGKVMGHPMGGDSRSVSADLELTAGRWGLVTASWTRVEHGFEALPGVQGKFVDPPVPHADHDAIALHVEKYWGPFPGALAAEVRWGEARGEIDVFEPTERWGATIAWRQPTW